MTNYLHSLVYDLMPVVTNLISDDAPFTKNVTDPSFNDMTSFKIFIFTILAGVGWIIVVHASFTYCVEKGNGKWLYSRNSFCCICNNTQ